MVRRLERRRDASKIDLARRARTLADRYDLPRPQRIRWADNQSTLWGSCTPGKGAVRISSRLAAYPRWVLDYVIVHELAHLVSPGHGRRFHRLVDRYDLAERARGFLIAKGLDPEGP
jgi:predicted metal-dependent hydrolase